MFNKEKSLILLVINKIRFLFYEIDKDWKYLIFNVLEEIFIYVGSVFCVSIKSYKNLMFLKYFEKINVVNVGRLNVGR